MKAIEYKDTYTEENRKVLAINILPEKTCNFDCVYCPFPRTANQSEAQRSFEGMDRALAELGDKLAASSVDLVFISSQGEALLNDRIGEIIDLIKSRGVAVRLLSNGYLLAQAEFMELANRCDEVIGEIVAVTEADLQKLQRPLTGYKLEDYIANMSYFNSQYSGIFILDITMLKGYNDDRASIEKLQDIIARISPDRIEIGNVSDRQKRKQFGISSERLVELTKILSG